MPAAWKNSAISRRHAAPPEMKNRMRPPSRARILLNTSRSASACCSASSHGDGCVPCCCSRDHLAADAERPVEDLGLRAALRRAVCDDPVVDLLEDARHAGHERRLDHGEVLDDLVDAAVDGGGEADLQLRGHAAPCRTSATAAATGTARRSSNSPSGRHRRALVRPARVQRARRPWAPGGARGVDQRGELVGADRADRRGRPPGVVGQTPSRRGSTSRPA